MRGIGRRLALASGLALALAGCETEHLVHGYMPDEERFAELRTGVHDRASVESLLGSPTAIGTFQENTWYYITRRTEKYAFFEEEVQDQQVVAIVFDDAGIVSGVQRYTLEDGQQIDPVDRETPTRGRELTIMEQLLGNIGRFGANRGQ